MNPMKNLDELYVEMVGDETSQFQSYVRGVTENGATPLPAHFLQRAIDRRMMWYDYAFMDSKAVLRVLPVVAMNMRIKHTTVVHGHAFEVLSLKMAVPTRVVDPRVERLPGDLLFTVTETEVIMINLNPLRPNSGSEMFVSSDTVIEYGRQTYNEFNKHMYATISRGRSHLKDN